MIEPGTGIGSKTTEQTLGGEGDDWIKNICTRPFAADWDGDGHLDLVVGNFFGTFYLFKGQGQGAFQPVPEEIKAGDQPLKLAGHHSDPFAVDWDGDGDLDLLSGSAAGGTFVFRNEGTKTQPKFAAKRTLLEAIGHRQQESRFGDAHLTVLRDGFVTDGQDPAGLYFGTRSGEVYGSNDDGQSWQLLAQHLPPVMSVRAAPVSA